jgi:hypothetical protein
MSDGYCLLQIGPVTREQRTTEIMPKGVSAVWEARFIVDDIELSKDEFEREKISFEVWDKNNFTPNTLIGS